MRCVPQVPKDNASFRWPMAMDAAMGDLLHCAWWPRMSHFVVTIWKFVKVIQPFFGSVHSQRPYSPAIKCHPARPPLPVDGAKESVPNAHSLPVHQPCYAGSLNKAHERADAGTCGKSPHRMGWCGSDGLPHVWASRCQGLQNHSFLPHHIQSRTLKAPWGYSCRFGCGGFQLS